MFILLAFLSRCKRCNIARFKVVLTCVINLICVNIRFLGVQSFKTNFCALFQEMKIKRPCVFEAYFTNTKLLCAFLKYWTKTKQLKVFQTYATKQLKRLYKSFLGILDHNRIRFLGVQQCTCAAIVLELNYCPRMGNNCRGSRVKSRGSWVKSRGSRVKSRGSILTI